MKKILLLAFAALSFFSHTQAQYCSSVATASGGHEITKVYIANASASLNNQTACFSLTGSQGVASGTADAYSDFTTSTTIARPKLRIGDTYSLTVQTRNCYAPGSTGIRVAYIDWNRDSVFQVPSERIVIDSGYSTDSIKTVNFVVPTNSNGGIARMRIVFRLATSLSSMNPCGLSFEGETEDYEVQLVDCANHFIDIGASTDSVNIGSSYSIKGYINPSGAVSYQWRKNGVPISGATSDTFNIPQFSNADTGCYTLRVVFPNGCEVVSNPKCLKAKSVDCSNHFIDIGASAASVNIGSSYSMMGYVTPSSVISYQWRKNGVPISGATSDTFNIPQFSHADTGCYTLRAVFANGCEVVSNSKCLKVNTGAPKCSEFKSIFYTKSGSTFIFSSSGPASVSSPYSVKYNWTFSNGQTSTQKNPSTTFTTFPAWAKLRICIDSGTTTICCDSFIRDSILDCNSLLLGSATINVTCFGVKNGVIILNLVGGKLPYTYQWSNGSTAKDQTNLGAGTYSVTVIESSGCSKSETFTVIQPPPIVISLSKTSSTYTATVSGGAPPYKYLWNNGDTTASITTNANGPHCITVTDDLSCIMTKCDTTTGGGSKNPCASYRYINYSSSSGKTFNFSSGVPTGTFATFYWTFGNGATSTQSKPSYTYPNAGSYNVKVKYCLLDSTQSVICCDSADKNVFAVVPLPCNVNANFKWTKLTNGQVQFTDSTKPDTAMYTYYWVFGDGTTSTQKNPLKTFATNGAKTVCLYVTKWNNASNTYCKDTVCKTETITNVSPCNRLEPNFAWTSTGGVYSFMNTTNLSGFNLIGISYIIHNSNTTYTTASPSHTFTANGTYMVTMTIVAFDVTTGTSCTKTISKTFYVNTSVCGCFKAYNSFSRTANLAHFTNTSQCVDTNTKYLYQFGNGDTSSQPNPNYYYPLPGLYRTVMYITRTLNGVTCKDSFVRIVQITTANPCKDSGYVNNASQPCGQFVSPVCGCDTVTYKNYCFAMRSGVKQWTYGPCPNDTTYVKICGYVYRDINKNCAHDSFDQPIREITLKFNTTPVTYAYTNTAGYYQIYLPKGTYQVSQVLTFRNPPVNQLCPTSSAPITVNATAGGATYCNNNFFDTTSLCPDIAAGIFRVATITPGFTSIKAIRYSNRGAVPITSVVLKYRFLSTLTVKTTTTPTYTVSGNVISWNLGTLAPYTNGIKYVYFQTPTTLPLGTAVVDSVWIEPAGGDCDPSNNYATFNDTCVGSYDPNDKAASPADEMAPSVKTLDYLIRFQNTGTAPAHDVRIEDKIDDNFEKASLKVNDFSHKMNYYFDEGGKIYFEFPNIMLPDSGTDYEASQGYVSYSIQLKDNLPVGTKLKNTAEIYFDFNEPIITNTTVNTIVLKSSSGVKTEVGGLNVSIYPNPTQNIAMVEVNIDKTSSVSYTLFNIQGKRIYQKDLNRKTGQVKEEINLEGLNAGIYILNLSINGQETSLKLVKE